MPDCRMAHCGGHARTPSVAPSPPTHLHGLQVDALGAAPHHAQVLHGGGGGSSGGARGRVKAGLLRALTARSGRCRRGLHGCRGRAAAARRLRKQALWWAGARWVGGGASARSRELATNCVLCVCAGRMLLLHPSESPQYPPTLPQPTLSMFFVSALVAITSCGTGGQVCGC